MLLKKLFPILLICFLLLLPLASCGRAELENPLTFLVANDLHYLSPTLLGDGSYFITPQSQFDGKVTHYSAPLSDAFFDTAVQQRPQALILAGDLTYSGAKVSHEELIAKLQHVKKAGVDLLVIPGNHDIDTTAVDYSGDELREATGTSSADFVSLYEPLLPHDRLVGRDEYSFSYFYEASEHLWILMLDTNLYGKGFVKDGTLLWLEDMLKSAEKKRIDVISVTHQNLYAHSELLSFGYQLYNASALLALYEKYGVQCNFTGHIHVQSIYEGKLPEIASSSQSITGTRYGRIAYNGKGLTYTACSVNVSSYAAAQGMTDPNLLAFEAYATAYFEDVARLHATERLADIGLAESEIVLMAETYAKINTAYFEGRKPDKQTYEAGLTLWREKGIGFMQTYIDSMLQSGDRLTYTVKFQ